MTSFIAPILGLVGIIAAAALGAFGKEWFVERRAQQRADSPAGQAEAKAITLAINLDREKWLDQQTRGLFENVHEQLERALVEIAGLRGQITDMRKEFTQMEERVVVAERRQLEAEAQRDEMRVLMETIKNATCDD